MGTNTTTLDQNGYGLCGTCRRKFYIRDLDVCAYCQKWVCNTHKKKLEGLPVCPKCYEVWKKK
ncbi:MAG: hypothetical protein IJZ07_07665 [Clostridia bacterium]|nr:hypothetical protein [Clostridia bacterium]